MWDLSKRGHVSVQILSTQDGMLVFEGYVSDDALADNRGVALQERQGKLYPLMLHEAPQRSTEFKTGDVVNYNHRFLVKVPLVEGASYVFVIGDGAGQLIEAKPSLGLWAKFGNNKEVRNHGYWCTDNFIVQYASKRFAVDTYTEGLRRKLERCWLKDMANAGEQDYVHIRKRAVKLRRRKKREIWIISDRIFKGGDNAENFFKYAVSQPETRDKDLYFLFDKNENPQDYERLRQYGTILDPASEDYKVLFLAADKIISSHFGRSVTNPFLDDYFYFKDLFDFDYVYLTHGVMPGDLSPILNRLNKNIRLFVTSSPKEYRGILEGTYFYTERELKLTGMPRHDALGLVPVEKYIVFLPTWRRGLAGEELAETRDRTYSETFKDSEYCKFYNALINDERLVEALKRTGYRAEFYVHPSFRKQAADFCGNEFVEVGSGLADYERILNEAALMVTDYSSVAFDFGYQRKPIVYCQFDSDEMEANHFYERGYYDYELDGFGPVTATIDDTVDAIVGYLERDCANTDEYRARGDAFFAFDDHENSKRVFDAIMALDGE